MFNVSLPLDKGDLDTYKPHICKWILISFLVTGLSLAKLIHNAVVSAFGESLIDSSSFKSNHENEAIKCNNAE